MDNSYYTPRKLIVDYIILKLLEIDLSILVNEVGNKIFKADTELYISKVIIKGDYRPSPCVQIATGREVRDYKSKDLIVCIYPITLFIHCEDNNLDNPDSIFIGVNAIADEIEEKLYSIKSECHNNNFMVQKASLVYSRPSIISTEREASTELDIIVEYVLNYRGE